MNEAGSYVVAIVFGAILFMIFLKLVPGSITEAYYDVIEICEADLPRSQKCIITAVPEVAE